MTVLAYLADRAWDLWEAHQFSCLQCREATEPVMRPDEICAEGQGRLARWAMTDHKRRVEKIREN